MDKGFPNILVQKFGGSSVATIDRLRRVAGLIEQAQQTDDIQVVAVVSAMQGETDRLTALAAELDVHAGSELDHLLSCGEEVSAALLVICLQQRGLNAQVVKGSDIPCITTSHPQSAQILKMGSGHLTDLLSRQVIPVVTGFQGIDETGCVTTLGRGGSDLTAIAVASVLNAKACHIYTDVDGVYSADPRHIAHVSRIKEISPLQMLDYSKAGAGVLQDRCLSMASQKGVSLRVLSSYRDDGGTLIHADLQDHSERAHVRGVASIDGIYWINISDIPARAGLMSYLLGFFDAKGIVVSQLVMHPRVSDGDKPTVNVAFSIQKESLKRLEAVMALICDEVQAATYAVSVPSSLVTIIGSGFEGKLNILSVVASSLSKAGIDPLCYQSTSSKIEMLVESQFCQQVVSILHDSLREYIDDK